MACAQENPLLLAESKAFRGREGINLLVMPIVLCFPFFIISFLFRFLSQYLLIFVVILSLRLLLLRLPPLCTARVLFIMPVVINFYHFSL